MLKNMERLFSSVGIKKTCRGLSIIFIFLFYASNAYAQRLSGHFLVSTLKFKQTLENLIVQKKPIAGVYETPIALSSLVPISINNVQYNLDWKTVEFNPIANNNIQFALVLPQLDILVPKLEIDTYLVKEVNGAIIKVRIQSSCENIKLVTSTDAISILAAISGAAKSDHVNMSANVTDINLGTPKLTVQNFMCSNITGFEDIVRDEILQQFARMDFYKPVLLSKINELLAGQVEKYAAKVEKAIKDQVVTVDGLSAPLFSLLHVNEQFIDIGFVLNDPEATFSGVTNYTLNSDAVMVMDKSELQEYITQSLSAKLAKLSYSSKNISALDKLTRSRFKQFFVWPALMKLPKGQELILRPRLESLSFTLKPDSYVSSLNLTATTGIWVMARNEAMVYMRSNLTTGSSVANTQIKTTIQSLKSSAVWDKNFLSKYNASKRISTSIVDSTAENFFNDNWATANLSVLKLTDTVSARLKKIFYGKDNKLYFELGLNN